MGTAGIAGIDGCITTKSTSTKKQNLLFVFFRIDILPFFVINISTDICCSCLFYKLTENTILGPVHMEVGDPR